MTRPLAVWMICAIAGCAGRRPVVGASNPPPPERSALLDAAATSVWRGDLDGAHHALGVLADGRVGVADPTLDFWSELVALLRCEPAERIPGPARDLDDPWDQLRRLVQIERVRLAATLATGGAKPTPAPGTRRARTGAVGTVVSWPGEAEQWADESPSALPGVDRCDDATGAASATARTEMPELPLVAETARALPVAHPARSLLYLDEAALRILRGEHAAAAGPVDRARADDLPAAERAELALAAAIAADATVDAEADATAREPAITRFRAALGFELPRDTRRHLALRLAEHLRAAGRPEETVIALGPPPHGDDAIGRYMAFRQAETHDRAGRRAHVLAEARAALGPHGHAAVEADPALAAVQDLAQRALLASPVTAETLEVVESLGVPAERALRVEALAERAATARAHASALAAFAWLMANETSETKRLHHLARAAVAAARAGDRREFAHLFARLAGQLEDEPAEKAAAGKPTITRPVRGIVESADAARVRKQRRAARGASWQRAMLVVARDALPALVEARDQAALAALVGTLQKHLTDHGRGPVDAELTTVYRAASAHLGTGPRAYAERVGDERRPILLGEITVDRVYAVATPESSAAPAEPTPLLFVPRLGSDPSDLVRWPGAIGQPWKGGTP